MRASGPRHGRDHPGARGAARCRRRARRPRRQRPRPGRACRRRGAAVAAAAARSDRGEVGRPLRDLERGDRSLRRGRGTGAGRATRTGPGTRSQPGSRTRSARGGSSSARSCSRPGAARHAHRGQVPTPGSGTASEGAAAPLRRRTISARPPPEPVVPGISWPGFSSDGTFGSVPPSSAARGASRPPADTRPPPTGRARPIASTILRPWTSRDSCAATRPSTR